MFSRRLTIQSFSTGESSSGNSIFPFELSACCWHQSFLTRASYFNGLNDTEGIVLDGCDWSLGKVAKSKVPAKFTHASDVERKLYPRPARYRLQGQGSQ